MLTKEEKKKLKKSAVMIDSVCVEYICPNNRNGGKKGHFYRSVTSGKLKKHPICPYCGKKTKMVKYENRGGKDEKCSTNAPNADMLNKEPL